MTDSDALMILAGNLERLRGDMSYSEIARKCGTHPANISKIAKGEHMPGVGLVTRIADALGVSVDDLLRPEKKLIKRA